jgi:hypothetical protein
MQSLHSFTVTQEAGWWAYPPLHSFTVPQ